MRVCVENILRPAHFLAFIFGICPYRKFGESTYRRSTLGTVLQLTNFVVMISVCLYVALYYLPEAFCTNTSSPTWPRSIVQTSYIFLSLWLTIHQFVWTSRTLRCLQVTDEVSKMICRISNLKQHPFAFYIGMIWTMCQIVRLPIPGALDFVSIIFYVTMFFTLYCETLVLEFVTVICIALDTINQKLQAWQTSRNYDTNDLKKLQCLYLRAAYLAEMVDDAFGISWLVSLFAKTIHIVLLCNWILKLSEVMVDFRGEKNPIANKMTLIYLIFRLAVGMLRCFHICYSLDQPTVKRSKIVGILGEMITRNIDNELLTEMNEFTLQVALRKMQFTAGGFFDMNLHHFGEIVGMWFTLFVILVQITKV